MSQKSSYNEKIQSYERALDGRRNILLPVYRKFEARPIEFWNPFILFTLLVVVCYLLLALVFMLLALAIHPFARDSSYYLGFFLIWQIILLSFPLALIGTVAAFMSRKRLKISWD